MRIECMGNGRPGAWSSAPVAHGSRGDVMDLFTIPGADLLRGLWLLGLSVALLILWIRVRELQEGQEATDHKLGEIRQDLAGLRLDLQQVAKAQQVEELRRLIISDLRPLVAEVVDLRMATGRPRRNKQ